MARKTEDVTITDDRPIRQDTREKDAKGKPIGPAPADLGQPIGDPSRDLGKTFRITEMPARQAEKWAIRALLAAAKSGIELPDDVAAAGAMRTIGYIGIRAITGLNFDEAEPLLDEMMGCVQIVEKALVRTLTDDDIEEVRTLILLKKKVLELHVGFSMAAVISG